MPIQPHRILLRPETILDKPSFTMVRSAVPFAPNNTRTCLYVRARQSDGTAGVDVWDVTDPPNVVGTLKAALNKVPFQDQLYLYPLGAIDNGQYLDLVVVMMGPSDKGIAAILRPFGAPMIVERNPLGVSALHPGIGIYAPPELSTLPGLGFYLSDSQYVYLVRAGTGLLDLVGQSKLPQSGTILTRPTDNLNQYDPKKGTSKTAVFFIDWPSAFYFWFICDPETGFSRLESGGKTTPRSDPVTPITVMRSGPTYDAAGLVLYYELPTNNIRMEYINGRHDVRTLNIPASSVVAPVGSGQYIYFTSVDLQRIQIIASANYEQRTILVPALIVGQPGLGANGDLIVTYDGRSSVRPSGCLAMGTDGAIKWTYEPADCWRPLTAAVYSQGWIGFFGTTADNKPFVDLFAIPG